MQTDIRPDDVLGRSLKDSEGRTVGTVSRVYFDNRTRDPEWIEIMPSGWRGKVGVARSFVPVEHAALEGDAIRVPYDQNRIRRSPRLTAGEYLSSEQEARLCYHYGCTEHGHGSWSPHTGEGWPVQRWFFGGPRYGWMAGNKRLDDHRRDGDGSAWGPRKGR